MKLSSKQVPRFWREWAAACRVQGWTDRATMETERHALLSRAGFTSLTDVDRAAGFDRVLAEIGRLASNVARTAETLDPPTFTIAVGRQRRPIIVKDTPGLRRRLLWLIHRDAAPLGGARYVLALPQCRHLCSGVSVLEDLSTKDLYQLVETVNSRRWSKAAKAPEPEAALAEAAMDPNVPF